MSNIKHTDLIPEVTQVLVANAARAESGFMTAYQIFAALKDETRQSLVAERGPPGKGSGHYVSAATIVSLAARNVENVEVVHLDCRGVIFVVGGEQITPGYEVCGAYRLRK